jgi:fluoride exporter
MQYLIIFVGSGIGGIARHVTGLVTARFLGDSFPYGTLFINVIGSFVMGLLAGYFAFRGEASQNWRLFWTTGILSGFTTFSTFSLDTALLYERGKTTAAVAYVVASVVVGIAALFLGLAMMRR